MHSFSGVRQCNADTESRPKTSRPCRANSSLLPFLGDLPTSFHLPSGHRISSCLSRSDFVPPPSCIAIDIDIPRHF
ncbi:unnamed protein product [Fusarium venenatum]|uniref:Uncharacterized protein n=1 Tax=Fusarium venenatum TaxID=56646 RepID=A0A2L2TYD3_9HYPO|nr:uncharacterized protein FVRRES_09983 [Fusarium venenatum]CEI69906.1 unnamed protein product [Fusarium venenatum]